MKKQRRVFGAYPDYLKTPHNDQETYVADDQLYEPEDASFLLGYIGNGDLLTSLDLKRTPLINESSASRKKYQLSIGVTYIEPDFKRRESAAFYTDLIGQIGSNGGLVDDPNRVFETDFYAWSPPIDYDKHMNFSRYFWIVPGEAADIHGVYITKEPEASKTSIYEFDGTAFNRIEVPIADGLPPVGTVGSYVEDASNTARPIFRSNGTAWIVVDFLPVEDIPTDTTSFVSGDAVYVARTGPDFNRPLVWLYSDQAKRWVSQSVVVSLSEPENPRLGMVWEDARVKPQRKLKIYDGSSFVALVYTNALGPTGIGTNKEHIYDIRNFFDSISISGAKDPWSRENWWRHFEDLSPADRAVLLSEDQAVRPIVEFWNGIESIIGDTKDSKNDQPVFKKYAYNSILDDITDTGEVTTVYAFGVGTGKDDIVLGFPLEFNDSGEFLFNLTLESDTSDFIGYKYFKDTQTGLMHSIWFKSDEPLMQNVDSDGLYDVPRGLSSNPNHTILTKFSRSKILNHMVGVIGAQAGATGSATGPNGYRWSIKDPASGSTIIDSEQTLLRAMATLQTTELDMPTAIRESSRVYQKTLFRFRNRMNQMWDEQNKLADPAGTLLVSSTEAVDAVLTELFTGRTGDFPYSHSNMGTYLETRIDGGLPVVIDPNNPKPIFIPPSPPKVGASPVYFPTKFVDTHGITVLRGHEGYIQSSFGDDRDLMWLNLQERFFAEVPDSYKTEDTSFSARNLPSNFFLGDYYGNKIPATDRLPVSDVIEDYNSIVAPVVNQRVFSTGQAVFADYDGSTWLLNQAVIDDVFLNNSNSEYYIFNGKSTNIIDLFNNQFSFDYSDNEYRRIIQNDFSRLVVREAEDLTENNTFDENDKFTWNYSSAGVEGNYRGQYRRLYNTIEPHIHAWEVVGYTIEPGWWTTEYVPDSVASDGTPRYGNAHQVWVDFQSGIVNPITGKISAEFVMLAPIPVDSSGELLDPVGAGIVKESSLDYDRIDDSWKYGDGAPVEQSFYDSPIYPFSVALSSYLMKNGRWIDLTWVGQTLAIGDAGINQIATAPHFVSMSTLKRPNNDEISIHLEVDDNGIIIESIGTNSWISDSVLAGGGSPTNDFAKIIDNTEPALIWKTSGFINSKRTTVTTLSGNDIPFEDVFTILHTSQPLVRRFASGVVIEREQPSGYRIYGTDPSNPVFEIDRPAIPTAPGQFERRESIIATSGQHDFITDSLIIPFNINDNDTTKVSILINGMRLKPQHIIITSKVSFTIEDAIEINEGDDITATVLATTQSPSAQMRSFKIKGIPFNYFPTGTGERIAIEYGRFFETPTEVINFMLGYGRALGEDGWVFDDMEDATNSQLDWMNGARQFAAWVIDTESIWNPRRDSVDILDRDRFTYSPLARKSAFTTEFGISNNIESTQNGYYGIVDLDGIPIDDNQTFVSRSSGITEITATGSSDIYGVRINLIEMQHVIVFSNITKFNDIIYDPVLALSHNTLRVDSYRTNEWTGRPEAAGYIINQGELLPNFEKQAFDFTRFYDRIDTPDSPVLRDSARNLYGWTPNDSYMDIVGAADRTRFDYFRGMLNAKGTVRAVTAYTKGTILGADNVFVYEDWAWKVQQFGDENRERVQFNISASEFRDDVQVMGFGTPVNQFDNIIEIQDFDRNNSAIGTVKDPTFLTGDFAVTNDSNTLNFVTTTGGDATAIADEINQKLAAINMVGVSAFVFIKDNSEFLGLRNTGDFIGSAYTLIPGTINDLLTTAGITPGTYTTDNTRWILPALTGQSGLSNVEFPVDSNNIPDIDGIEYFAQIFDSETGFTLTKSPQFDPELGKFDPIGLAGVDYTGLYDPARYNIGPDAERSNGLVWCDKQVGDVWWDITRRSYVDYRRPIDGSDIITFPNGPEYQSASSVWGNLEFFRADITRAGDVATVTTLDVFSKVPVISGLSSGDIINIRGANEPEWNVSDVQISLGPVIVIGTIEYQEEEAAGTVYIPSSVTISGGQLDGNNQIVGTTAFANNNSVSGTETNPVFAAGDNFEITTRDGAFQFTSAAGGTVIGLVQEINQFLVSNGINGQVEVFNDFDSLSQVNRMAFRNPGQVTCGSGDAYELKNLQRGVVGSVSAPIFSAGDAFSFTTDSDSYGFASVTGGNVAAIVLEINTRFANPPLGKNPIIEVEAFDSGGKLGFRNTVGFEGKKYLLVTGTPNDLLGVAGIPPGQYGGLLDIAGIPAATYQIIPGEDFSGAGTGADFSMVLFKDLLTKAGIDITTTDSKVRTGLNTLGTVVAPVFDIGDTFEITVHQETTVSLSTSGTTVGSLVTQINSDLVAANITAIETSAVGNKLSFVNVVSGADVTFDLATGINDLLPKVFINPGTYTTVIGNADVDPYLAFDTFNIEVDIVVPIVVSSTTLAGVVLDINAALINSNIISVVAVDNAGKLEFTTTGNDYTLFATKRFNYINQSSANLETVVADINSSLGGTEITEVQAFFSNNSLGFQNSLGSEGVAFILIGGTQDDLLSTTGIPLVVAGALPIPYDSVFSGGAGAALEIIPSGFSFDIATDNVPVTAGSYTTTVSSGIDELVSDINAYLVSEGITVVTTQNVNDVVVFINTAGNGGDRFKLVAGVPNDLLNVVGITAIPGFFEIIPALSDFSIATDTIGPISFSTPGGGNLDTIVSEINTFLITSLIVEVEAVATDNKLIIRNTVGNEGKRFVLTAGTVNDLLSLAGVTAQTYGSYPAGSGFAITTPLTGIPVTFATPNGGTLDAIVTEINSFFSTVPIPEVEAVNSGGFLRFENTNDSIGVTFDLIAGVPNDLLVLTGIVPGTFTTDLTKFTFAISSLPTTPATGDIKVQVGSIDVYEWVESPVAPENWVDYTNTLTAPDHATGIPLNADDPSYVKIDKYNNAGQLVPMYYFWVKGNTGINPNAELTTAEVETRLISPTLAGSSWFAPMDANFMAMFTGGVKIQDGYAVEVIIDERILDSHAAWVLISEGDQFKQVPPVITSKLIDSMSGIDKFGTIVPLPELSDTEKFGSCEFPVQTVFVNTDAAIEVYLTSINQILKQKNLGSLDELVAIFQLSDEFNPIININGFWEREDFVLEKYSDKKIFDTVVTITVRDFRGANGFYAEGDLVKVEQSGNLDPFEEAAGNIVEVGAVYSFEGGLFLEIGLDKHTIKLNNNLNNDTNTFRSVYQRTYDAFNRGEQNLLVFSLLHEMMRQSLHADWFIKTSYLSTQVFDILIQSPFVRPDETQGVINNILDVKPFRSKLRSATSTLTVDTLEEVPVFIQEIPNIKIGLRFDRLSCNLIDDGGWDSYAWDDSTPPAIGWDMPIWDFANLGTEQWYTVGIAVADGIKTTFTYDMPVDNPPLYKQRVVVRDQFGNIIDNNLVGITITALPTLIKVDLASILPSGSEIEAQQTQGLVERNLPITLGLELEDTLFEPIPSSYKHHVARTLTTGDIGFDPRVEGYTSFIGDGIVTSFMVGNNATSTDVVVFVSQVLQEFGVDYIVVNAGTTMAAIEFTNPPSANTVIVVQLEGIIGMLGCSGLNDDLGGRPEERIGTEVIDSVNICVTNSVYPLLGSWDATPWDTTGWDMPPVDVGDRVFIISVGAQENIAPGLEIFPTSEDLTPANAPYVIGSSESYVLVDVLVDSGLGFVPVTEGVEYIKVTPFNNILEFGFPAGQQLIGDGVQTQFNVTIQTGTKDVRLDGVLLNLGVDYLLSGPVGNEILDFAPIQPIPPTHLVDVNFISETSSIVASGSTFGFDINLPLNSLTRENVFVFKNSVYVNDGPPALPVSYSIGPVNDVTFNVAPNFGDEIIVFGFGNTFSDNAPLFAVTNFTGNNILTSFLIGNITPTTVDSAFNETVFVFLDGIYQNPGIDYILSNPGTPIASVDFIAPPPPTFVGNIEVRIIDSPVDVYDVVESTWVPGAGPSSVIPGVTDALHTEKIMIFRDGAVQDLYTALGVPDLTLSGGNTINWTIPLVGGEIISFRMIRSIAVAQNLVVMPSVPLPGSVVDIAPNPYLLPGDVVRLIYNGWFVGPLGPFEVVSTPGPYDVVDKFLVLDTPSVGGTITINYKESRNGDLLRSILTRMPITVSDILADHLIYDDPLGAEENRTVGINIVDTALVQYFQWDGINWNSTGVVLAGDQFYVTRTQEIWEYDGSSFNKLFSVGDAYVTPPLVGFPVFGRGVTYGTYAFGTATGAAAQWPEAYEIMQHPGSCVL